MKTLRKCLYLVLGLFVFGLVSCANDSSSNNDALYYAALKESQQLDCNQKDYRDGWYVYRDGTTTLYLCYENKALVYAGNRNNEYTESQLKILKESHSWQNVHKYCTREDSLFACNWIWKKYSAEKLFKKGWYCFSGNKLGGRIGYFESIDSSMSYTVIVRTGGGSEFYRTKKFEDNASYDDRTWRELFSLVKSDSGGRISLYGEELEKYPEEPSQSE
jgi:hypothetical protein